MTRLTRTDFLDGGGGPTAVNVTNERLGGKASLSQIYAAVAVSVLHVIFATAALWPRMQTGEGAPRPELRPMQVLSLPGGISGVLLEPQDGMSTCLKGKSYRGIGLQFNLDQIVIAAPASYPAFQAGIRTGDLILNPEFEPTVDGYDVVNFMRRGKHHRLRVMTQWICLL